MLMHKDHSHLEMFPLKLSTVRVISKSLKFIKVCTGFRTDPHSNANLIALPVQRVREIQAINRKGKKVDKLKLVDESWEITPVSQDLLKNNSLTRFDPPDNKIRRLRVLTKEKTEDSMIRGINRFSFVLIMTFLLLLLSCKSRVIYTNSMAMAQEPGN